MLDSPSKLGKMIVGMNKALGEIPVTVKLRTGVKDGHNTAHKLMPRIRSEFGVGAMTVSCSHLSSEAPIVIYTVQRRHTVARPNSTATLQQARRLGLHSTLR